MPPASDTNFCGISVPADGYDDASAVRAYVALHCRNFMTPLERRVTEYVVPLVSDSEADKARRLYSMLEDRDGHVDDCDTLAAFAVPWADRERNAVDRIIREYYTDLPLNRCPSCGRLVPTPLARQCLWCGNRWHTRG